jgi:GAF domain-containing protein
VLSYEEPSLDIHPAKLTAGAKVLACLPLVVAGTPVGVLYVYLREERRFTQLELLLLSVFVNQAAIAMYHAGQLSDVQRELARREDELARLRRAGLLISSRRRPDETLEAILQMALEVTGAKYGIFRLVDRESQNLVTRAIAGERLGRPAVEALPLNTTSIMGWIAKFRQPLNIADVRTEPWARIYYPLDYSLEMRSELAVPLIGAGGRLEGVLNLESPQIAAFSEQDSHLLQAFATQAVIAIQDARLMDALLDVAARLLILSFPEVLHRLVELAPIAGDRQAHDEFASLFPPLAAGLDTAAVHLDHAPHDRQPDAQAALRPVQRPFVLDKQVEDVGAGLNLSSSGRSERACSS